MDEDPIWIGTPETARRLGLTLHTLYRLIDAGDLPADRFGRLIRVRVVDLQEFVEACRIRPKL